MGSWFLLFSPSASHFFLNKNRLSLPTGAVGNRIPNFHLKSGSEDPRWSLYSHVMSEGESQRKQFKTAHDPRNGDRQVWKRCWDPGWRIWGIPFFFGMFRTSHTGIKEGVSVDPYFFFSWRKGREVLGSVIKYWFFLLWRLFVHPTEFPACFPSPSCWNSHICGIILTFSPSQIPASSKNQGWG